MNIPLSDEEIKVSQKYERVNIKCAEENSTAHQQHLICV